MFGFAVVAPLALTCVMIALALHERGRRRGMEDAEQLYAPVLELATKWAELHLAYEKKAGLTHEKLTNSTDDEGK